MLIPRGGQLISLNSVNFFWVSGWGCWKHYVDLFWFSRFRNNGGSLSQPNSPLVRRSNGVETNNVIGNNISNSDNKLQQSWQSLDLPITRSSDDSSSELVTTSEEDDNIRYVFGFFKTHATWGMEFSSRNCHPIKSYEGGLFYRPLSHAWGVPKSRLNEVKSIASV